ncbi:MAG: FAD-binding oxidoreductase [Oscillospiraceae bacterium]|jgi:sarcosine oxidase subunit beta|nr:FAD-binding oxidoreductase [Oscillospiraceae bacterium]MDD3260539.1 FAD-binding oxidoreductase [Oscillospiraceae bacterium]
MNQSSDVVIIGSGIVGSATAYYLAKKGVSVTVLEASDAIGNGGSSRNGGGVRQSGRDPRELPLVMWGIQNIWPSLGEELDTNVEYTQKGNLRLGKTEAHLKSLQNLTDRAVACGLDVRMISGDEVRQINPYLSHEVIGASWCPTDGHANPLTTTLGYFKTARRLGAQFITGEPVLKIRKEKGKVHEVVTPDGTFTCGKVLAAAGYDTRTLTAPLGVDIPMRKKKSECLVTEAEPPLFAQMLGTAEADFYGHQTKHGSFVFGGSTGLELYGPDDGPAQGSTSLSAPCTCRGIMKYFPALSDAKIVRTWAGWTDVCADGIPVIGPADGVPGLYIACGFTGHGFGIGPAAAYSIAEMMTCGTPPVDMRPFRCARFKAKI